MAWKDLRALLLAHIHCTATGHSLHYEANVICKARVPILRCCFPHVRAGQDTEPHHPLSVMPIPTCKTSDQTIIEPGASARPLLLQLHYFLSVGNFLVTILTSTLLSL